MATQLRVYTISRGSLTQFAEEWRQKVYPLRLEHGYDIHGAWIVEETHQFVWLISYEGAETWEEKEQEYYGSEVRQAMDPNPARLIARPEHYFLESIL